MAPDATLELSIEQLIGALNKKLLMECTRVQSAIPPITRALVSTLTAEVDALEKQARDVLHEVATLRNSLRPVNRLPPELLTSCTIFVSDTDPRPIVTLTHVCRYWRRSINSNPRSWASIATRWKRLVPICLERAGSVPLAVDLTVSDIKNDEDFLRSLLPHTSMIGCLRLAGYPSIGTVADDLPSFFGSPMPNLTSLELQQAAEPAELFPSSETPAPPVFQNVEKLGSLLLTRTPLYPALFAIKSLRELKLLGYTSLFNFGTFVGFLRSNLELESVTLDIQFVTDSVEAAPTKKVPLSHLRHLSITCSKPIDSKGLLSSISLPQAIHIEVISTHSGEPLQLGSFLPSPPTPIRKLLAPITTIKTQITPWEIQLFGNDSVFTFRSRERLLKLHPEMLLFPLTAVRELYTNLRPYAYTEILLSAMMKVLPALEILAISKTAFPAGLLSALTVEPASCPSLRTIAFFDCDIDSDTIKNLGEAIAKRRDSMGARLYRVVIVNSTGTPPDLTSIQQLRMSVPCVEVRVDDKLPDLS